MSAIGTPISHNNIPITHTTPNNSVVAEISLVNIFLFINHPISQSCPPQFGRGLWHWQLLTPTARQRIDILAESCHTWHPSNSLSPLGLAYYILLWSLSFTSSLFTMRMCWRLLSWNPVFLLDLISTAHPFLVSLSSSDSKNGRYFDGNHFVIALGVSIDSLLLL